MKCKYCKCKVNKEDLVIKWINYFCSNNCYLDYIDNQKETKKPITQRKAINKISKKKKQRIKEWWSEVELFKEVANIDKTCWICNKVIQEDSSYTFPHLLSKWQYKAFRLVENNIWRVCSIEHHNKIDSLMLEIRKDFEKLNKFKEMLLIWKRSEVRNFINNL